MYNKKSCNIIISKSINSFNMGNPLLLHYIEINNNNNIPLQIRNSYKNPLIKPFVKNDIAITSWIPIENYNNEIIEIEYVYDNSSFVQTEFSSVLTIKENDYVINLEYF